ncbi:MAG: ATP-binding cassette domain-containing protein [Comamonas sp.]
MFDNQLVLETDNWGVAYGDKVILAGVHLQIVPQAITALMGPVGGGKSTLIRSLAGVNDENPRFRQWGEVRYAGAALSADHRPRMVRQHARLMLASVQESLTEFRRFDGGQTSQERTAWARSFLERMGFPELTNSLPIPAVELSPVQQRAIAILREVAAEPALLMVDEPTAELSDYDSYLLLELLKRVAHERAVLLITHNQRQARGVADRVLLLAGGSIQESNTAEDFFSAPYSPAGLQFVRSGSCAVVAPALSVEQAIQAEASPAEPAPVAATAEQAARQSQRAVLPDLVLASPVHAAEEFVSNSRGPRGFAWLVPGKLAGTPLPGVVNDIDIDLKALKRCGVTVLVSLTEKDVDQEALARNGLRNVHLPVYDREPPTVSQLQMLMLKMKRLLLNGEVLAVHCLAGLGRTGTVLAAWLVFEGVTAEEALRRVREIESQYVQSELQESSLVAYEEMLLEKMG